ncbi:MAG: DEAD/DEAH box helicase, partial [Deltaproteobacteria bacterium]|nr:DEAD/DEAH box helicase [Deltaproteobacteria bacterium]
WIALEAIKAYLQRGKRIWYASPLKALSNSKYEEFKDAVGVEHLGILTGDRKENPDAAVIVGTTEILRNQLYDAMQHSADMMVDLVVLDEAHYLSDPERGVVWEEILIYLPRRIKLLLLSATLENAAELAQWLFGIRGAPCSVVNSEKRPVPLVPLFLFPDGEITPLSERRGIMPSIKKFVKSTRHSRRSAADILPQYGTIIRHLRSHNLLPAIFFLKSRADCDRALLTCHAAPKLPSEEEALFQQHLDVVLHQFPFLRQYKQLSDLMQNRVGSHHAGKLPQWKLLIEGLMQQGLLDAIFATSTVAAGVNFPARTVVLVQSDRFDGKQFSDLTSTELHQMTGRAGRRGMDNIGFALILPGTFQDPILIDRLFTSRPEPIKSQIQVNFSMALNLLLSHRPEDIRALLEQSLATFQNLKLHEPIEEKKWDHLFERFKDLLPDARCDLKDPDRAIDFLKHRQKKGGEKAPCKECPHISLCYSRDKNPAKAVLSRIKKHYKKVAKTRHRLWFDFQRYLAFLKETGFATPDNHLTPDGVWASKLRLDQPLLIADCIRKKSFDDITPELLAALIGTFVFDKTREVEVDLKKIPESNTLVKRFTAMMQDLEHLRNLKITRGFETPPLQIWPSAALFVWSLGMTWFDLLERMDIEEGDLAMLILRTADHLRQGGSLKETHPSLAEKAHQALPLILREPVVFH